MKRFHLKDLISVSNEAEFCDLESKWQDFFDLNNGNLFLK